MLLWAHAWPAKSTHGSMVRSAAACSSHSRYAETTLRALRCGATSIATLTINTTYATRNTHVPRTHPNDMSGFSVYDDLMVMGAMAVSCAIGLCVFLEPSPPSRLRLFS